MLVQFQWFGDSFPNAFRGPFLERKGKRIASDRFEQLKIQILSLAGFESSLIFSKFQWFGIHFRMSSEARSFNVCVGVCVCERENV